MKAHVNELILRELDALRDEAGRLQPESVVNRARDPSSAIHDFFEWEDDIAAEKYRLSQARGLIRSVRLELVVHDIKIKSVAYVRDPSSPGREAGYLRMSAVAPRSDLAREVVLNELSRVASALSRARQLATALDISDEIEALLVAVAGLREDLHAATEEAPAET